MSVLKIKRGSTAAVNAYTPPAGELVLDTTLMQLRLGDGLTLGGINAANASTALKLATARNIALSGAVSGTIPFDGSANVSIVTTLAASIALTGVPTTPTAAPGTNTTQVASTAFVAAADALKADLASPTFTGIPLAPTPAVGTNTTQIATAEMVQAEIANKRAWTSYTPTVVAGAGSFTTASATGSSMEAFGIRYVRVVITITTKGTGTLPTFTLPVPALAGTNGLPCFLAFKTPGTTKTGNGRVASTLTSVNILGADGVDLLVADGDVISLYGSYPVA